MDSSKQAATFSCPCITSTWHLNPETKQECAASAANAYLVIGVAPKQLRQVKEEQQGLVLLSVFLRDLFLSVRHNLPYLLVSSKRKGSHFSEATASTTLTSDTSRVGQNPMYTLSMTYIIGDFPAQIVVYMHKVLVMVLVMWVLSSPTESFCAQSLRC
jgi:hypothetical protein